MNKKALKALGAVASIGAILAVSACGSAKAGEFPNDSIEIIVPWAAGGSSDTIVRAFAEPFSAEIGETVLVVNRPGGGSAIGAAEAAKAKGDGYTLLHSSASTFVTVPLRQKVSYTPEDFNSVVSLGDQPIILVTGTENGWKSLEDVKKANEQNLQVATTSQGNLLHLVATNFVDEIGKTSESLPFDGSNETILAVSSGDADIAAVEANIALAQIKAGEVVPLAVTTVERLKELPDVPTFGELGYTRSANKLSRIAISVPSDTPDEIKQKLSDAGEKALKAESWKEYAKSISLQEPEYTGSEFMNEYIPNEINWTKESFPSAGLKPID